MSDSAAGEQHGSAQGEAKATPEMIEKSRFDGLMAAYQKALAETRDLKATAQQQVGKAFPAQADEAPEEADPQTEIATAPEGTEAFPEQPTPVVSQPAQNPVVKPDEDYVVDGTNRIYADGVTLAERYAQVLEDRGQDPHHPTPRGSNPVRESGRGEPTADDLRAKLHGMTGKAGRPTSAGWPV